MNVEATRTSFFGWSSTLRMQGRLCGEMSFAFMSRGGSIDVDGASFAVSSQGLFTGTWDLMQGGRALASAKKASLPSRFALDLDGVRYELRRQSLFSRSYELLQDSRKVGKLESGGWFSRKMVGDLPDQWAPQHRAFAMWLVMMMWRRRARRNNG